jgi:hypothetical protein
MAGLGQTYTNAERPAMLGIPMGAVMTARHSALKLSQLQSGVRSPSSRMPGVAFIKLERSTIRSG